MFSGSIHKTNIQIACEKQYRSKSSVQLLSRTRDFDNFCGSSYSTPGRWNALLPAISAALFWALVLASRGIVLRSEVVTLAVDFFLRAGARVEVEAEALLAACFATGAVEADSAALAFPFPFCFLAGGDCMEADTFVLERGRFVGAADSTKMKVRKIKRGSM